MNYSKLCDYIDRRTAPEHGADMLECWELDKLNRIREKAVALWNRSIDMRKLNAILDANVPEPFKMRVRCTIKQYDKLNEATRIAEMCSTIKEAEKYHGLTF